MSLVCVCACVEWRGSLPARSLQTWTECSAWGCRDQSSPWLQTHSLCPFLCTAGTGLLVLHRHGHVGYCQTERNSALLLQAAALARGACTTPPACLRRPALKFTYGLNSSNGLDASFNLHVETACRRSRYETAPEGSLPRGFSNTVYSGRAFSEWGKRGCHSGVCRRKRT